MLWRNLYIEERKLKMILSLIVAYIMGKVIGLGVLGLMAWFFIEVLGAILTLIIENWIYVLLAVIIIPFVLYWIAIGLAKLMEFF